MAVTGACASRERHRVVDVVRATPTPFLAYSAAPPGRFGAPSEAELAAAAASVTSSDAVRDAWTGRARVLILERRPTAGESLDDRVSAVLEPTADSPIRLAPLLGAGGFVIEDVRAEALAALGGETVADVAFALVPSVSVRVGVRRLAAPPSTTRATLARLPPPPLELDDVLIVLRRSGGSVEAVLELATSVSPPPPEGLGLQRRDHERPDRDQRRMLARIALTPAPLHGTREVLVLTPAARLVPTAFLVRSPFEPADRGRLVALTIELDPTPPPSGEDAAAHAAALSRARADLAAETVPPGAPPPLTPREEDDVDPVAAREQLEKTSPRLRLATLAARLGAPAALDVASSSYEHVARAVAFDVARALARRHARERAAAALGDLLGAATRSPSLGLEVERAAIQSLMAPERRDLGVQILSRYYGVAFLPAEPGTTGPAWSRLQVAGDLAEVTRFALRTNLVALESPFLELRLIAARALELHGLEGYSPLAPVAERRAAVDKLWAKLAPGEGRGS